MKTKIILLASIALALVACKDKGNTPDEPIVEPDPQPTEVNAGAYFLSPVAFNGTFIETSIAMMEMTEPEIPETPLPARIRTENYPTYQWTPQDGTWPVDLTVNYGPQDIVCTDGLEHSGVLKIKTTAPFETPNAVLNVSFENFKVYGTIMTGAQTITNKGTNAAGNLVYEVVVQNGLLGGNSELTYSESTTRELIAGLADNGILSPDVTTHTYSITGLMHGESNVDSVPGFNVSIEDADPMIISVGDQYPTSGKVHISFNPALTYMIEGTIPLSIDEVYVTFTGKNEQNQYGVLAQTTISGGALAQDLALTFLVDENGIVDGSVEVVE